MKFVGESLGPTLQPKAMKAILRTRSGMVYGRDKPAHSNEFTQVRSFKVLHLLL